MVPKMIEEELNCKADEENARKKLVEAAQREAGLALEAEGSRLQQVFSSLQERIQDAKSLAAAACKPMPLPEKVCPSASCLCCCVHKQLCYTVLSQLMGAPECIEGATSRSPAVLEPLMGCSSIQPCWSKLIPGRTSCT